LQDTKNRQNSIETNDTQLANEWERAQKRVLFAVEREYQWAIANGIAKEQARAVLPEGITASRLYMQGTLRSWVHYIELRSGNGTQLEHQNIARECATALEPIFPMIREFVATE
jgi:thymidylate synthase (FAD)